MKRVTLLIATCVAAVALGCNGDDNNNGDGGPDGSKDVVTNDVATDGGADSGDGACNFAAFVTDLINNHTTSTDLPSTNLGQNCVDNQNQAEFKPLFP